MTTVARRGIGPLGRRLLAAFVLVALSSVVVLTVAALVGTERGLSVAQGDERQRAVDRAAQAAAAAYLDADGWFGADLAPARSIAEGAGAQLVVRDAAGAMVWPRHGTGTAGMGGRHAPGAAAVRASVLAGEENVGTAQLTFWGTSAAGRSVAWSWVAGAGAVALLLALAVSWYVARRLTVPLVRLAGAARAFANGDRSVRSGVRPPGELGELARAFDGMADAVVRADTVRRQLAGDVAHELRTPLGALQAGLEELRDGLSEPDPARLAGLHDQALRLGRVVDDLAELAAAEAAALSLRKSDVDLTEVVAAALDGQEPRLRAAGLGVARHLSAPVWVSGDADRLHQVVGNLLANAARYCRPGDQVSVRVVSVNEEAVIEVADTGPGLAPDVLPHVFERLWRGPEAAAVAGSGIGLAVVRELVTAHGGAVAARSSPGQGATFTIRLPLAAPVGAG